MAYDRWAWLEGIRPMTAAEAIAREFARVLVEELRAWPPRVELTEGDASGARFAPLLAAGAPHPAAEAIAQGLRLARWDLGREHEALDQYMRNGHLARACPALHDQLAAELVWRFVVEACLEVIERTDGRVRRAQLLPAIDTVARALAAS